MSRSSAIVAILLLAVGLASADLATRYGVKVVSLAQTLDQNRYSSFPGDPPVNITIFNTIAADGYKLERINSLGTHTSTHMSAPCHFIEGAKCIDQLAPSKFIFTAAVIDVSAKVAANFKAGKDELNAYQLTWQDIKDYEKKVKQQIPADSIVMLYTGFGKLYGTPAYGERSFPGFSADAVQKLFDLRQISATGSDTFGPDASNDANFDGSYTTYANGGVTIENMAGLDQLAGRRFGDVVVATPTKLKNGSGYQCNVLSVLKNDDFWWWN